ncbi:MAG: hypothetical protein SGILL_001632 [Bacillariaceae sp.]
MASSNSNEKGNASASPLANSTPDDEFVLLREYLLQCPHVPRTSPAMKGALEGLERHLRDAKLQAKFGKGTTTSTSMSTQAADADVVVVENVVGAPAMEESAMTTLSTKESDQDSMEWQDVQEQNEGEENPDDSALVTTGSDIMENGIDTSSSYLGKKLAKTSVDSISEHRVHVSSPVAAIAVAFHAALRSPLLGFACTGIPENPNSSGGGFAPPVRELPKTQFLPLHWENNPANISLRYRKNGTGALVLTVQSEGGSIDATATVQVTLLPANSKEPPTQSVAFPLAEHINLDSWNAALKAGKNHKIAPSLHYKGLAGMLSKFCETFDLGAVVDTEDANLEMPYVDNTVVYGNQGPVSTSTTASTTRSSKPTSGLGPLPGTAGGARPVGVAWKDGRVPATLDQAFPDARRQIVPGGDFAGDLLPSGLQDPRFLRVPGRMGGNLMGPGHPMFNGDGLGPIGGPPIGGPGSMQPRFDPVYPPGIDDGQQPLNNQRRNGRQNPSPSRTGEPNPDHLPPPNSLGGGSDMFM